ncbi:MAG: 50S ribosomal protein L13 [Patescibacteria group bacterium]
MNYTFDAENKILGRLATEIAVVLRGKDKPAFDPAKRADNTVTVINANKIRVTGDKMRQKLYRRHSGYPGGLKEEALASLLKRDPTAVLRHAVSGMLPKNKSRKVFLRHLIFRDAH